MSLRYREAEAM